MTTGQGPFQNAVNTFGGSAPADMAQAFGSYQSLTGGQPGSQPAELDRLLNRLFGSFTPQAQELALAMQNVNDATQLGVPLEEVMATSQQAAQQPPEEATLTVNQALVKLLTEVLSKLSRGLSDIAKYQQ